MLLPRKGPITPASKPAAGNQPLPIIRTVANMSATAFVVILFGLMGTAGTGANFTSSVILNPGVITVVGSGNLVKQSATVNRSAPHRPLAQQVSDGMVGSDSVALADAVDQLKSVRAPEVRPSPRSPQDPAGADADTAIPLDEGVSPDGAADNDTTATALEGDTDVAAPTPPGDGPETGEPLAVTMDESFAEQFATDPDAAE